MATYKVIQNIEAEDKLLGPLTLRQFLYAAIGAVALYLCYFFITHGLYVFLIIPLPIVALAAFLAFPWSRDQPTEVWAVAKVRFYLKPHKRIWDQTGIKEMVTVTAPKKIVTNYTNNLTPQEVQSRLKALAATIDTRGWVTKNVNVNLSTPDDTIAAISPSDRLVSGSTKTSDFPNVDIRADEDILDEHNNPTAQHFEEMINKKEQEHHANLVQKTQQAASGSKPNNQTDSGLPADYWFLNQPDQPIKVPAGNTTFGSKIVIPGTDNYSSPTQPSAAEEELAKEIKNRRGDYEDDIRSTFPAYVKVIKPPTDYEDDISGTYVSGDNFVDDPPPQITTSPFDPATVQTPTYSVPQTPQPVQPTPTPQPVNPAIINLAGNNDRDVASIAREANQVQQLDTSKDEVIITLH